MSRKTGSILYFILFYYLRGSPEQEDYIEGSFYTIANPPTLEHLHVNLLIFSHKTYLQVSTGLRKGPGLEYIGTSSGGGRVGG